MSTGKRAIQINRIMHTFRSFRGSVNVIPVKLCIYKAIICAFLSCSSGEPPLHMRVIYDFTARNRQELSVMKGDVVQVRCTAVKSYILDLVTPFHFYLTFCLFFVLFLFFLKP